MVASSTWPAQAPQSRCRANPACCYLHPAAKEMVWVGVRVAPNLLKIAKRFLFLGCRRALSPLARRDLSLTPGACHAVCSGLESAGLLRHESPLPAPALRGPWCWVLLPSLLPQTRASGPGSQERDLGPGRAPQDGLLSACVRAQSLQSCPTPCDPRTVAHQAPPSMGFSRHGYWSELPCPPPGALPS